MSVSLWNWFVKITGWPVQKILLRTKIYYEDKAVQSRKIRGSAVVISNHTSVYDYALYLFVFWGRTLRVQMGEVLFEKKLLGWFLRRMGGIRVNRNAHDFSFLQKSEEILYQGGVVEIFPESRLPKESEKGKGLLPFVTSAAYIALSTGAPIIPVYTNGAYFCKKRAEVVIGKPFFAAEYTREDCSEHENLERVSEEMRRRILLLKERLGE